MLYENQSPLFEKVDQSLTNTYYAPSYWVIITLLGLILLLLIVLTILMAFKVSYQKTVAKVIETELKISPEETTVQKPSLMPKLAALNVIYLTAILALYRLLVDMSLYYNPATGIYLNLNAHESDPYKGVNGTPVPRENYLKPLPKPSPLTDKCLTIVVQKSPHLLELGKINPDEAKTLKETYAPKQNAFLSLILHPTQVVSVLKQYTDGTHTPFFEALSEEYKQEPSMLSNDTDSHGEHLDLIYAANLELGHTYSFLIACFIITLPTLIIYVGYKTVCNLFHPALKENLPYLEPVLANRIDLTYGFTVHYLTLLILLLLINCHGLLTVLFNPSICGYLYSRPSFVAASLVLILVSTVVLLCYKRWTSRGPWYQALANKIIVTREKWPYNPSYFSEFYEWTLLTLNIPENSFTKVDQYNVFWQERKNSTKGVLPVEPAIILYGLQITLATLTFILLNYTIIPVLVVLSLLPELGRLIYSVLKTSYQGLLTLNLLLNTVVSVLGIFISLLVLTHTYSLFNGESPSTIITALHNLVSYVAPKV